MSFNFYELYMEGNPQMSIVQRVLNHTQTPSIENTMG